MTQTAAGQPTLVRALGLRSLVLFGLAYMTPLIVLGIFGVVAAATAGASASAYLEAQFPAVPGWLWVIGFILITTALNVIGIKVADKANYLLMAFQLLVIVLFVALSITSVVRNAGAGGLVSASPFAGIGAASGE